MRRSLIIVILITLFSLLSGCGMFGLKFGKTIPIYNPDLIKKRAAEQPAPLWQFPSVEVVRKTHDSTGLGGVKRPDPEPEHLQGVEPPFVIEMKLLSDGSLAVITPLQWQYATPVFGAHTVKFEIPSRVMVTLLDGATGKPKWTQRLASPGLYTIVESEPALLISVEKYDSTTWTISRKEFIALSRKSGGVLWRLEIPDETQLIPSSVQGGVFHVLSATTFKGKASKFSIAVLDPLTGRAVWTRQIEDSVSANNADPMITPNGIMLFKDGVAYYSLPNGKLRWRRQDLAVTGLSQPQRANKLVYFQIGDRITALEVETGRTIWTTDKLEQQMIEFFRVSDRLYVRSVQAAQEEEKAKKKGDKKKKEDKKHQQKKLSVISALNLTNGKLLWTYKNNELIAGNIVATPNSIFFTTNNKLMALERNSGQKAFERSLPWQDSLSYHELKIIQDKIAVITEWDAAVWATKTGELIHHHYFEPLWPAVTTAHRKLDEATILGKGKPKEKLATINALRSLQITSFTANTQTSGRYTSNYGASRSSASNLLKIYSKTGDKFFLDAAKDEMQSSMDTRKLRDMKADLGIARKKTDIAMAEFDRDVAKTEAVTGFVSALATTLDNLTIITYEKIGRLHSMLYPAVDNEVAQFRSLDHTEYIIRLVGIQDQAQRFSALSVLHPPSGRVTQLPLSPFQSPGFFTTAAQYGDGFSGYIRIVAYLHQNFHTVVDLERKRVFHYGPGLDVDNYTYYQSGFARGSIKAYPLILRSP